MKSVDIPLFRGYVFIRIDINIDKLNVLQTDGVVKFIGIRNRPSRIPDEQINWVHIIAEESDTVQNEKETDAKPRYQHNQIAQPFAGKFRLEDDENSGKSGNHREPAAQTNAFAEQKRR